MKKVKNTIKNYGHWLELMETKSRHQCFMVDTKLFSHEGTKTIVHG